MSAVRWKEVDAASGTSLVRVLSERLPVEINGMILDVDVATVLQFWKDEEQLRRLTGRLPVTADFLFQFFIPPGFGIPLPDGELWLSRSVAAAVGGLIAYSFTRPAEAPAIEDASETERVIARARARTGA